MRRDDMDEHAPELWWRFRFKDGSTVTATNWTPEKVQRAIAKHGPLVGIAPA